MKAIMEEYGKIVILGLAIFVLLGFVLSSKPGGFLYYLKVFQPEASVSSDVNQEKLSDYQEKADYVKEHFQVIPEKLHLEEEYIFSDYVTNAVNYDGDALTVSVVSVVEEKTGQRVPVREEDGKYLVSFSNDERKREEYLGCGRYIAEYEAYDASIDYTYPKKCVFVVDTKTVPILDIQFLDTDGSEYVEYPFRIYKGEELPEFPEAPSGHEWHFVKAGADGTYEDLGVCDLTALTFRDQMLTLMAMEPEVE